jgi:hypothetical protein
MLDTIQHEKMHESLTPGKGTERKMSQNKPPKDLSVLTKMGVDMQNPNSYGDGKTLYIHGKTFHQR